MTTAKRTRLMFKVSKGALVPADGYTVRMLRERGFKIGDVVAVDMTKPRSPGFWRLAHQLGTFVAANIDEFAGMGPHDVLKRLQFEARIECDETDIELPGIGVFKARKPRSLAFESMDQAAFFDVLKRMCHHIASTYWPHLTAEQVQETAQCMPEEAT
jgi:hypothetical protein